MALMQLYSDSLTRQTANTKLPASLYLPPRITPPKVPPRLSYSQHDQSIPDPFTKLERSTIDDPRVTGPVEKHFLLHVLADLRPGKPYAAINLRAMVLRANHQGYPMNHSSLARAVRRLIAKGVLTRTACRMTDARRYYYHHWKPTKNETAHSDTRYQVAPACTLERTFRTSASSVRNAHFEVVRDAHLKRPLTTYIQEEEREETLAPLAHTEFCQNSSFIPSQNVSSTVRASLFFQDARSISFPRYCGKFIFRASVQQAPPCSAPAPLIRETNTFIKEEHMTTTQITAAKKSFISRWNGLRKVARLDGNLTNSGDAGAIVSFINRFGEDALEKLDRFLIWCQSRSTYPTHGMGLLWTMARSGDLDDDCLLGDAADDAPASNAAIFLGDSGVYETQGAVNTSLYRNGKGPFTVVPMKPLPWESKPAYPDWATEMQAQWNQRVPTRKLFGLTPEIIELAQAVRDQFDWQEVWPLLLESCDPLARHEKATWLNLMFALKNALNILNGKYASFVQEVKDADQAKADMLVHYEPTAQEENREPELWDSIFCDEMRDLDEFKRPIVADYWLRVQMHQAMPKASGSEVARMLKRIIGGQITQEDMILLLDAKLSSDDIIAKRDSFIAGNDRFTKRAKCRANHTREWPIDRVPSKQKSWN